MCLQKKRLYNDVFRVQPKKTLFFEKKGWYNSKPLEYENVY